MTPNPTNTIPVISAAVFDKDSDLVEFDCNPPNVLSEIQSVHHQIFADHPNSRRRGKNQKRATTQRVRTGIRDPASLSKSGRRCVSCQRASSFHQLSHSIYQHSHHPRTTGTGRRSTPVLCRSFRLKIATQMGVVYSQVSHVEGVKTTWKQAGKRRGRGGRESKGRGEGCPTASGCMDYRRVQRTGHEFASQPHIQLSFGC